MESRTATVEDILNVFELAATPGDLELDAHLRAAFEVDQGRPLVEALADVDPGVLLAVAVTAIEPVAAMIRDIYSWLGEVADIKSVGNLSIPVGDALMNDMDLDLARYRAYERSVLEGVQQSRFVPSRLPSNSPLFNCHDLHWPPTCFGRGQGQGMLNVRCCSCEPQVAERFGHLEKLLSAAAGALAEEPCPRPLQPDLSSGPRNSFLSSLARWFEEVSRRTSDAGKCSYSDEFVARYLREGLTDLEGCFETVTVEQLRSFFDLPYWKHRWQLYEIWILHVVMDSFGTPRWSPRLTGTVWDLKAGSLNRKAIATVKLRDGSELRCYYQHQSAPPEAIVEGAEDRPEILVTRTEDAAHRAAPGTSGESVILAVEAKARKAYALQDLKSATFALVEWHPDRILGSSYFPTVGAPDDLHTRRYGDHEIALATRMQPGSPTQSSTNEWLRSMWRDLVGVRVAVFAVDVSGSMTPGEAAQRITLMGNTYGSTELPGIDVVLLTTFGCSDPTLNPLTALTAEAISETGLDLTPRAPTEDFSGAITAWTAQLTASYPKCESVELHLFTDGEWASTRDLQALQEYSESGVPSYIHLVGRYRELISPELRPFVMAATSYAAPVTAETSADPRS